MHDGRATVGEVDISTAAFADNPIPGYNRLREASRVSWQHGARGFLPSRYDDIARAYREPVLHEPDLANPWRKIGRTLGKDFGPAIKLFSYMPFTHEGERHRELRTTFAKAIAPFIGAESVFARCVERRLAVARRDGGFDLAQQFAGALLFDVVCDLMELPEPVREEIRPIPHLSWVVESTLSVRDREATTAVAARCMAAFAIHVGTALEQPGDSLLHSIHRALPESEEDKAGAVATIAAVMLMMGNDGLGGCISFAVQNLLTGDTERPLPQEQWAQLSDDALRYSATIDFQNRIAVKDVEIAGCPIRRGDRVILSPLAANHDPTVIGPDAGSVRPRPKIGTGLTFGAGAHVCVGARMARNIARAAFLGLAQLPPLKVLAPGTRGPGKVIRTLSSLPVELN